MLRVVVLLAALLVGCARLEPARRVLLLITVDTLRADRLTAWGNPLGLTPNLDGLAGTSEVFRRAYAPAPFTLASIATLLTGRYPDELGIVSNLSTVAAGTDTLASRLRSRGWRTGAVVSSFVLREACGLNAGFDEYDATYPQVEAHRPVPERTAADTADAALRMLDRLAHGGRQPVFLWVHFQDPHGPYMPPAPLRARFLDAERRAPDGGKRLAPSGNDTGIGGIPAYQLTEGEFEAAYYRAGYDGEAHYADEHIGRVLRGLAERGLRDETITVFAADHGEGLGEGDYWFAHGEYLSEALLQVPLLIAVPGRPPGVHDQVVALVDVLPTLAALLELPVAPGLPGRNLLVEDGDRASTVYLSTFHESTVRRVGIVQGSWKYVATADPVAPTRHLYRLGSDDNDVLQDHPDVAEAMASALGTFQGRLPAGASPRAQPVTPEDRARLRALGYVGE